MEEFIVTALISALGTWLVPGCLEELKRPKHIATQAVLVLRVVLFTGIVSYTANGYGVDTGRCEQAIKMVYNAKELMEAAREESNQTSQFLGPYMIEFSDDVYDYCPNHVVDEVIESLR